VVVQRRAVGLGPRNGSGSDDDDVAVVYGACRHLGCAHCQWEEVVVVAY
jgi:Rieske Fe-S protein